MQKRLSHLCLAEFIGTLILVFFGVGSVHTAVLTGAQSGLWQVAIVWGVAISLAEAIGTAFLAFFVFALTDQSNEGNPGKVIPTCIGLIVSMLISVIAPLTQAGFNPARDFGPRLFSFFAGWGKVAIPGPRGGFFTVYILAPIIGALIGGAIYEFSIKPAFLKSSTDKVTIKSESKAKELVS